MLILMGKSPSADFFHVPWKMWWGSYGWWCSYGSCSWTLKWGHFKFMGLSWKWWHFKIHMQCSFLMLDFSCRKNSQFSNRFPGSEDKKKKIARMKIKSQAFGKWQRTQNWNWKKKRADTMRLVIKQLSADNTKEAQDTAGKTSLRVTQTQCPVGMLPAPAAASQH